MKLSIIIVNYNVKYFLEQCLDSVLKATTNITSEIFVVDNDSSDGSLDYLKHRFKQVKFISSGENIGFSRANNSAIKQSSGEYILLLNPDTFVGENVIENCVSWMDSHPDTGGVGVKMLGSDGAFAMESRRGFPSPLTSFYKISGLCTLFPYSRHFGKYYLRYLDKNEANPIDIISGAYMFLRHEALMKTGLLDETFFMYGEDIDLSYRILLAGYKNYYLPVSIIHYKGESTKKESFKYVYTFYDAMLIFFKKHFPHYSTFFSLMVKSVIYLRAFMALIHRTIAGFIKKKPLEYRFIVLGSETTIRDIGYICKKNHLSGRHHYVLANERTISQGHSGLGLPLAEYSHVIYDTSAFSYSKILSFMEASSSQSQKIELGTYSPKSKVLITPEQNFS